MAAVNGKIAKAVKRLLEVDPEFLPDIQTHLRDLRRQADRLQRRIDAATTLPDLADTQARVTAAFEMLRRLPEVIESADPILAREFLQRAIRQVDLWGEKHAGRWRLIRGKLALSANLFPTT